MNTNSHKKRKIESGYVTKGLTFVDKSRGNEKGQLLSVTVMSKRDCSQKSLEMRIPSSVSKPRTHLQSHYRKKPTKTKKLDHRLEGLALLPLPASRDHHDNIK